MDSDTIAAIATPLGSGGIGIIRISGKGALGVARALFRRPSGKRLDTYRSHRLYYGQILDPKAGGILDEVLMVYMQAPRTYTREDVVEIHTHSGPAVLKSIFDLVLAHGTRVADPGEFTKRAFLNGRIDLTQAEAVIDVVHAKTRASLEIAAAQIRGGLRKQIKACRSVLLQLQTLLAAAIDFPEEPETVFNPKEAAGALKGKVLEPLQVLIDQYAAGRMLREGIRIVVIGMPNVGKSSLMNRLLERQRAIVSPHPGTTRDFLEERLHLRGLPTLIVDTAGLQETDDPVERIGIEKTREKIREADLLLLVVDATRPDFGALPQERFPIFKKPALLVINKMDRVDPDTDFDIPGAWRALPQVRISALTGHGIESMKDKIFEHVTRGGGLRLENPIVPNARQKEALNRALKAAEAALEGLEAGRSPELISMDAGEAVEALGEILGETLDPDVLDAVFSRFCVGK